MPGSSSFSVSDSAFTEAGTAVSDVFAAYGTANQEKISALGLQTEATDYTDAAVLAKQNQEFTAASTAIQQSQTTRQVTQAMGRTAASVAGAGFANSGSALDIMASNAQQGALSKAVLGQQGLMTEAGYSEEATQYTNMATAATQTAGMEASAAKTAETGDIIGGVLKGAAAIAGLVAAPATGGASLLTTIGSAETALGDGSGIY